MKNPLWVPSQGEKHGRGEKPFSPQVPPSLFLGSTPKSLVVFQTRVFSNSYSYLLSLPGYSQKNHSDITDIGSGGIILSHHHLEWQKEIELGSNVLFSAPGTKFINHKYL